MRGYNQPMRHCVRCADAKLSLCHSRLASTAAAVTLHRALAEALWASWCCMLCDARKDIDCVVVSRFTVDFCISYFTGFCLFFVPAHRHIPFIPFSILHIPQPISVTDNHVHNSNRLPDL